MHHKLHPLFLSLGLMVMRLRRDEEPAKCQLAADVAMPRSDRVQMPIIGVDVTFTQVCDVRMYA